MNSIPNPDSWMDVLTIIAVTLIVALPSWFALRAKQAVESVHTEVKTVREQVVNGHTSPLRSDVDGMKSDLSDARVALSNLRDEVRGGFASVRADLAEERSSRRDGDLALREEIHDRQASDSRERVAREKGDQILRDDLDAHRYSPNPHGAAG